MCLLMRQAALGVGILKTDVDPKDDNYWNAVNEEAEKSLQRMIKYSENATDDDEDEDSETLIQKIKNKFRKDEDEDDDE